MTQLALPTGPDGCGARHRMDGAGVTLTAPQTQSPQLRRAHELEDAVIQVDDAGVVVPKPIPGQLDLEGRIAA